MNEYLRRPERVQAMRWTLESAVELSRWLDECGVGHHFHDEEGGYVEADGGNMATMCLDAGDSMAEMDEIALGSWITYSQKTGGASVYADDEFRSQFQVTL